MKSLGLKKRSDLHLARKMWHACGVLLIAYLHSILEFDVSIVLLVFFSTITVAADTLRMYSPKFNNIALRTLHMVMRENEIDKYSGNTYLIFGVLIITLFFPHEIVSLALLFLAFADPLASFFGIKFGKTKIAGNKSLEGFLAALGVCFILTYIYLQFKNGNLEMIRYNMTILQIVMLSFIAGIVGAFSEILPIGKLDDNLTLPVLSATGLYVAFSLFGALPL